MRIITKLFAITVLTLAANSIYASAMFTGGHADIGMAGEDGLELHFHAEGATIDGIDDVEAEYEPGDITISVPEAAYNGEMWALPQSHNHDLPFLGIGTGEAEEGLFVNDTIKFTLIGITTTSGTGNFSLWQEDAFGTKTIYMSTEDGISDSDSILLSLGHAHYNWGFTAPGTYELQFEASAELTAGGIDSSIATFTFQVVPEPTSATLIIAAMGMFIRRR